VSLRKRQVDEQTLSGRQLASKGVDALQRGRSGDAEQLLSQATKLCPLDERIRWHYADTLWSHGAHQRAVQQMEEAVRLSGGNAELRVRLGEMYLALGDLEKADREAELGLAGNPQLPSGWALKGDVLRQRGQLDECLCCYHRALGYVPHYPRVQLALGETYRDQKRYTRALATLRALSEGYPVGEVPPQVTFLQGLTLKDLGRHDAAADCLAALAKQGQPSAELLYHLADSQMQAGDDVNARLTVQSALALAPEQGPSRALYEQLQVLQRRLAAKTDRVGFVP
jgi:tetratricopeptide (TPR) repeat protein